VYVGPNVKRKFKQRTTIKLTSNAPVALVKTEQDCFFKKTA